MKKGKKKKEKRVKRKFRIFIVVFAFAIIVLFAILLLGAYVFDTKVKSVVIHDNTILSDTEIIKEAGLENYPNFYLTTSSKIKKKLKENPFIYDIDVKKNIFFEFHIYVKERKPLFIREDTNKIVFSNKEEIDNNNYNISIPTLVNYVPDTKYSTLINKMSKIDYNIIKKISDIKYYPNKYDEDRFVLYMNDSNLVYINLAKFKNLNKYDEMVTKFEGKTGTLYLDSGNYFSINKTKNR
ncbi:MAG: FtsQ-type POTRA domain-containing protein [bacterium]|nr:FtsQ-type POTRA domain-containing protein [bacterium]